ncbi:flavin reductase family protein [Trinickia mobilis]|uniref:flavin reductase family protein n=1 Tax=Trinickia mobilis TaxID=2816356 RepID=UPI0021067E8D|nr:flavin reductase family protein [Trinickia mobilis]
MFYKPGEPHGLPHNPLISCVVPRPIGWISTLDTQGVSNLAPFSLFNLVRYDPPVVMFSANGRHGDGGIKDSVVNARTTGEFVYNMATWDARQACNESSASFDRGVSEFEALNVETLPSKLVRPRRVKNSPVQFECKTSLVIELPSSGPASAPNTIVFGDVVGIHIADWALKDGIIDIPAIRPLARMGYLDFTSVDSVFPMPPIGAAKV